MNRLALSTFFVLAFAASASAEIGVVRPGSVTFVQDPDNRHVTISYILDSAPAVVTVDVQTNTEANAAGDWVSIGDRHLRTLSGAVNKKVVNSAAPQQVFWLPHKDWPEGGVITDSRVRAVVKAWPLDTSPPYIVIDLKATVPPRYYVSPDALPLPYAGAITNDPSYKESKMVLRRIPAASVTWRMGAIADDTHADLTVKEKPHMVTFTNDYYIGVFPVTVKQCQNILIGSGITLPAQPAAQAGNNGDWQPVVSISYETIRGKVSDSPSVDWPSTGAAVKTNSVLGLLRARAPGYVFDLPTEAHWEYAYRAGEPAPFYNGLYTYISTIGWQNNVYGVGQKVPNAWGLYDICGNGFEWCRDWYKADYSDGSDVVDPTGPDSGSNRIVRNGPWTSNMRASDRAFSFSPGSALNHTGFRVTCPALVP